MVVFAMMPQMEVFAQLVLETARAISGVGRFNENLVFIYSVWQAGRGLFDPSLVTFKRMLLSAHAERLVRLCRLEHPGFSDPVIVRKSCTPRQDKSMESDYYLIDTEEFHGK